MWNYCLSQARSILLHRPLLIMDVNGVLLHSINEPSNPRYKAPHYSIRVNRKIIIPRRSIHKFFEFCFFNYDVAIWSCLQKKNLFPILEGVLSEMEMKSLVFIFHQEQALDLGYQKNSNKPIFLKPLSLVTERYPKYREENILIIDDSPYKCALNPFYSSLHPSPYTGDQSENFLFEDLIPLLRYIHDQRESVHARLMKIYPNWSLRMVKESRKVHKDIWELLSSKNLVHVSHSLEEMKNN